MTRVSGHARGLNTSSQGGIMKITGWCYWNENEKEMYNTKKHQIIRRELNMGLADRTRAENKEKFKKFMEEFGHIL